MLQKVAATWTLARSLASATCEKASKLANVSFMNNSACVSEHPVRHLLVWQSLAVW